METAAATFRADGAHGTGDTVGDLMTFVSWDGAAAEAARESATRIKLTSSNHADECSGSRWPRTRPPRRSPT